MSKKSFKITESVSFFAFLDDLEACGVVPVDHGGIRYVVVAARSNPRCWLVPLDDRRAAASGLDLFQPLNFVARLAKAGALTIVRFGPLSLFGKGILRLSNLPLLGDAFGDRAAHVAYFTGTDGPHRKTTFQVMDQNGVILGYAKVTRAAHIKPYLRNEAEMLHRVKTMGLRHAAFPKVLSFREDPLLTILVTDGQKFPDHSVPLTPGPKHFAFLGELRAHTEYAGAMTLLDAITARTQDYNSRFATLAGTPWTHRFANIEAALRPYAEDIPLCFCHGDFTPWNTYLQAGQLHVFDWEYARRDLPVGYDLAHFLLSTLPPETKASRLNWIIEVLANSMFDGNTALAKRALLLSLACHAEFYLRRILEVNGTLDDWPDADNQGFLIDCLLTSGNGIIPQV